MDVTTGKHTRWPMVRLGDVCEIKNGKNQKEVESPIGKYPIFGSAGKVMGYATEYICEPGTTIIGRKGTIDNPIYVEEKFWNVDTAFGFSAKSKLNKRYLYYFCLSFDFKKLNRGTTLPSLVKSELLEIPLPLPPLAEQQRIVARLDAAFAAIAEASAAAEANLRNARALFDSYLGRQSSQKVKLGQFIDIKTGKLDANAAQENGKYVFFTCAKETYKIDAYAFDCEAILLAGNNAVGDFNVKHFSGKFNAYQRTYVITINTEDKLSYRWLYYQLLKKLKELKVESVGVGTKFLKIDMIRDLEIDLPDLQQQYLTTTAIDFLNAEVTKYSEIVKHKLVMMAQLKQSLLAEVFGE